MLEEQERVGKIRPDERPPTGYTLAAKPHNSDAKELLDRIKSVWAVAASWGRWFDEDLGEWPSLEECRRQLPMWMQQAVTDAELNTWNIFLHDRDWMWWSGAVVGDCVKIDLELGSMPASFFAMRFVIEKCNGSTIYSDQWIDSAQLNSLSDG